MLFTLVVASTWWWILQSKNRGTQLVHGQEWAQPWDESHLPTFSLRLAGGMATEILVEQRGVDLVVEISNDEIGAFEVDSPTGREGEETVYLIAPDDDRDFRVELRGFGGAVGEEAAYRVQTLPQRPMSSKDARRFAAELHFHRARVLQEAHPPRFSPYADDGFSLAAQQFGQLDLKSRQARALFLQGKLREQGTRYVEAVESYMAALELREHADGRVQLGNAWAILGRWQEAETSLRRALELYGSGVGLDQATVWQSLGNLYRRQGRFTEADHFLRQAEAVFEQTGPMRKRLDTLNSLGALQLNQGAPRSALGFLERAYDHSSIDDVIARPHTLYLLGRAHLHLGDLQVAKDFFDRALEAIGDRTTRVGFSILVGQGRVAAKLGDPERAALLYRRAIEGYTAMQIPLDIAIVQNNLAWLFFDLGHWSEAEELFAQALVGIRSLDEPMLEWTLRLGLGRVAIELERPHVAEQELDAAVRVVETVRSQTPLQDRIVVMASWHHVFETYVHWLMQRHVAEPTQGFDERAFAIAEQSKARALLDVLMEGDVELRHLGSSFQSRGPFVRQVQRLLDDSSRMLSYHIASSGAYLWVVGPSDVQAIELKDPRTIEAQIRKLNRRVENRHQPGAERQIEESLRYLAEAVLPPIDMLKGVDRLAIIPSGELFRVPFGALPWAVPSMSDESRLIDRFELTHSPSSTIFAAVRRPNAKGSVKGLVAIADPIYNLEDSRVRESRGTPPPPQIQNLPRLEGTAVEVQRVAAAIGDPAPRLLLGAEADLQVILGGALKKARWVHFSTHGVAHESNPGLSQLALSQLTADGRWKDGRLTAHQVSALELHAELVVLSACHSGPGRPIRGEGLTGLTRSFLMAGAENVVVSLWAVDDAAMPTLMEYFYVAMAAGMPAAEALRHAQQEVRRQPPWRDPYYWAGIALFGDWH